MKNYLLYHLLSLLFSISISAQSVAYQPPNMTNSCNNYMFNLTLQTPLILGNQSGSFSVRYFHTNSDAQTNLNYILAPQSYNAPGIEQIYARVTNLSDNSFATTSFTLICNSMTTISGFASPQHHCIGSTLTLNMIAQGNNLQYKWYHQPGNGVYEIPGQTSATLSIPLDSFTDAGFYQCYVYNETCGYMSSPAYIYIDTPIAITQQPVGTTICSGASHLFQVATTGTYQTYKWYFNGTPIQYAINSYYYINSADFADEGDYTCVITNGCGSVTTQSIHLTVNTSCEANSISGNVHYDFDANGCDSNDIAAVGIPIMATYGNIVNYAFANSSGNFALTNLYVGAQTVTVVNTPTSFNVVQPNSYFYNMVDGDIITGTNFCLSASNQVTDAAISFAPTSAARPGLPASYLMHIVNNGTTIINGTFSLIYNNNKIDFVSANPAATTQTGNQLNFTISNLLPFESRIITLNFLVKTPPDTILGDILAFDATMQTSQTDIYPQDNVIHFDQTVIDSFDPNEIIVQQGATITLDQADEYLNYIVHFENTGNANAINIKIENSLHANLDWSTFRPVYASHTYDAHRIGNFITFRFPNINLPPTATNPSASKGYVIYKVKPKSNITVGEAISNSAAIFFDFNLPIITNTVNTQVINNLDISQNVLNHVQVYPNPASNEVNIEFGSPLDNQTILWYLYDIQGKEIKKESVSSYENSLKLDVSELEKGFYFLKINSGDKSILKKLVVE